MSPHAWESEESLTESKVRTLISEQIPDLKDAPIRYFNEGWDSWIFQVGDTHLFRFPKRESSDTTLQMELRLLPELEEALPLPIPSFDFMGAPSRLFPYHFAGYGKMAGVTAFDAGLPPQKRSSIAQQLGEFLSALHVFPREKAKRLAVALDENLDILPVIQKDALSRMEEIAPALPKELFRSIEKIIRPDTTSIGKLEGPSRMIHNDLCSEHLLLDKSLARITGVLDWGDAEFGDPAMDFAGLLQWLGPAFLEEVLQAYSLETDPDIRTRVRFLACCEGVGDIHYGLETGKKAFALAGARAAQNAVALTV